MKVLIHGNTLDFLYRGKCTVCGCVFEGKRVETETNANGVCASCPECGSRTFMKGYEVPKAAAFKKPKPVTQKEFEQ